MLCACFNIDLRIQRIKGVDNVLADALSRGHYNKVGEVIWEVVPHQFLTLFRYFTFNGSVATSGYGNSPKGFASSYPSTVLQAV